MKSGRGYVMRERARSAEETGTRILDAVTQLFTERPYAQLTLAAVADRAGVTVQTVIRRFGDKDGLVAAAAERGRAHVARQRAAAPVGDLPGIVGNLVDHYEDVGSRVLRLLAAEQGSPTLAEYAERGRELHRDWCRSVFAGTLEPLTGVARDRRLAQLVAVCDVYTWKLLRLDSGLSRRQTQIALHELLGPLLTTHR